MFRYTCFSLVVIVCYMLSLVAIAFGYLGSVECTGCLPCEFVVRCYCIPALWHSCCILACEVMVSTATCYCIWSILAPGHLLMCMRVCVYVRFFGCATRCGVTSFVVWVVHGCLVSSSLVVAGACVLLSVNCCLSSIAVCCVYSCVLMLAFVRCCFNFGFWADFIIHDSFASNY